MRLNLILLELAIAIKNYNTFYADLTGYDVIHPCVIRESMVKTGARGMPGLNCNAVDTRLSSSPTHLINREPEYEAKYNYSASSLNSTFFYSKR